MCNHGLHVVFVPVPACVLHPSVRVSVRAWADGSLINHPYYIAYCKPGVSEIKIGQTCHNSIPAPLLARSE